MASAEKILVLCDIAEPTTIDRDISDDLKSENWKTEADVFKAIQQLGYESEILPIFNDTDLIRQKLVQFQPHVIFNLVDFFAKNSALEQNVVSFLELLGIPFTGCNSTAITLCKNKGIAKKILSYHRIRVPDFVIFHRGKRIIRPKRLQFPIFIKPLKEEASYGISQASFVENDDQFTQRVQFIHEKLGQDALAEEYIEGRELYVSLLGNERLQVFPIREIVFRAVPDEEPKFASYKAKWDEGYRKRWGIRNEFAAGLDEGLVKKIENLCKKIFRSLAIDSYARLDLRLTPENELVFIEANPNPILAKDEDFALSATKGNLPYEKLIQKIIQLARR